MRGLYVALVTETIKVLRSRMLWSTLLFFSFIAMMMGFMMFVAKNPAIAGNSAVLSTKASFIGSASWKSFFSLLIQMTLVMSMLGPGIVTIWVFGREYSDRVVKDLLALPVSRSEIVISKFIIITIWSIMLLFLLYGFAVTAGMVVGLEGWSKEEFLRFTKDYAVCSLLTILLCTPIALVTSISRGYLLPVAIVILIMIVTQFVFVGLPGITPYFPWAVPALFSGAAGPLTPEHGVTSYVILLLTSLSGLISTTAWWKFADQK